MSEIINKLVESAKALGKTIVLTEGEDERVVKAASETVKRGIAKIVLLGDEKQIAENEKQIYISSLCRIRPQFQRGKDNEPPYKEGYQNINCCICNRKQIYDIPCTAYDG